MATMRMFPVALRVMATPNLSSKQDMRSLVRIKTINILSKCFNVSNCEYHNDAKPKGCIR